MWNKGLDDMSEPKDQSPEAAAEKSAIIQALHAKSAGRAECFEAGVRFAEERAKEEKITAAHALAALAEMDAPRYWDNVLKERDELKAEIEHCSNAHQEVGKLWAEAEDDRDRWRSLAERLAGDNGFEREEAMAEFERANG
jgi:hypothetical protein